MKPIDFDAHYAAYVKKWVRENRGKYKTAEQMESHLPEAYLRFLNQRADWLGGQTPGAYFGQFNDPVELIGMLLDYHEQHVDVPDLLLERIVDLGEPAVEPLMRLAGNAASPEELRITALNLLIELDTARPIELCLGLIDAREARDDVADVAAELLETRGIEAVPSMLDRLESASEEAVCTYLDLLCNFPGDPRIYDYTLDQFLKSADRRALFASYLAKIGDGRAIAPLQQALGLSELNYLDYIEIRNAIERLGGEVTEPERVFDGDPYYESLKRVE